MNSVSQNLERVREQIAQAAAKAGRIVEDVQLVAITKTHPAEKAREAIEAIKQFDSTGTNAGSLKQARELLEPTLTPATYGSVRTTHVISDVLTIAALWAMEFRRRRLKSTMPTQ